MTPNYLISKAVNKYKMLKSKESCETPSTREEKLLALEDKSHRDEKKRNKKVKSNLGYKQERKSVVQDSKTPIQK